MITAMRCCSGAIDRPQLADIPALIANRAPGEFIWLHDNSEGEQDMILDDLPLDLPPTVHRALIATETRPRCQAYERGVLFNLRAPVLGDVDIMGGDPLVSIRLWAEEGLLLSVSLRASTVLEPVRDRFARCELKDPGDVIIALVSASAEQMDQIVADLGDDLDEIESDLGPMKAYSERRRVTRLRTQAISYRRFVNPQRQALDRLAQLPLDWLDEGERDAVREAGDRFARMTEELESVRERAAVIHDELTDLRAERIDSRSLQISIVAMIFLPLTFITGLLGMNVDGIPFAHQPWAFWGVNAFCLAIAAAVTAYFYVTKYTR